MNTTFLYEDGKHFWYSLKSPWTSGWDYICCVCLGFISCQHKPLLIPESYPVSIQHCPFIVFDPGGFSTEMWTKRSWNFCCWSGNPIATSPCLSHIIPTKTKLDWVKHLSPERSSLNIPTFLPFSFGSIVPLTVTSVWRTQMIAVVCWHCFNIKTHVLKYAYVFLFCYRWPNETQSEQKQI